MGWWPPVQRSVPRPQEDSRPSESAVDGGAPSSPYDVTIAASGYANVTGLVSTFALAAVVLVFLIAATVKGADAHKDLLALATILFAVGFLGCLLGAFAFASLTGAPHSAAAVTNSMLIASVVAICLIAVLGGFEALAKAFLSPAASTFAVLSATAAGLAPVFVWFPLMDIQREFPPRGIGESLDTYDGWAYRRLTGRWGARCVPRSFDGNEQAVRTYALLVDMTLVGVSAAAAGLAFHFARPILHITKSIQHPQEWEYNFLGFVSLAYIGMLIVAALLVAADEGNQLKPKWARLLNFFQSILMAAMIALLP